MNCNENYKKKSNDIKYPECYNKNCFVLGPTGPTWPAGPSGGPTGPTGANGATGPQGDAGSVLNYADFYALMPPDNAATVAPGTDVSFPQDGPNSGTDISRTSASSFNLAPIGTYQLLFQVSVNEQVN